MGIRKIASQFRLVYKRTPRLTKVVVCAAVAVSLVAILVLRSATLDARAEADAWRQDAQMQEQEQSRLEQLFNNLGTLEGFKELAESLLGLVDPDTVIMEPKN